MKEKGVGEKKHGAAAAAAAVIARGKEAEQRKSIVRLLIEKWGRFMGYRQTELSLSRRLSLPPVVSERPIVR